MLYGHSWGGFAVTAVLNKDHDISAVVSIAAYATPMSMIHENTRSSMGIFTNFVRPFLWAYQRFLFGQHLNLSAIDGINNVITLVMVIHGTADDLIAYGGTSIIAKREYIINPNVTFITHTLPHHNGHNNIVRDITVQSHIDAFNQQWRDRWDYHNGPIPEEEAATLFASIRPHASKLNLTLMQEINAFFEASKVTAS